MLQSIRDRASGWIAYLIVFLISIPFALWGINEYFGGGDPLVAAEVNGNEIPMRTFTSNLQQQKRYMQSIMGAQLDEALIKENVMQGMVRNELLRAEVVNAGYLVGDQTLVQQISSMSVFNTDGKFDKHRYKQILDSQGRSQVQFEDELRQELARSQFEDGVRKTAFMTAIDLADHQRLKNQARKFLYFLLPADVAQAKAQLAEQEIDQYYENNKTSYQTDERVKLAYVELKESILIENTSIDESEVQTFYEEQADRYITPEERKARSITIKLEGSGDKANIDADQKAKTKAEELVARLRQGEDFAELAKQYSEDPLSASSGGELGFVARGDMDEAFEDILFGLQGNDISNPVKTSAGFQIIQLVEVRPAEQKPFDEVKDQVRQELKQRAAEAQFVELSEQLLTLSYEQSNSLESAADEIGRSIETSEWITRNEGEGIGQHSNIRQAAFSEEVLQERRNSDIIELADGDIVVVRVIEHEPAILRPLGEVKEEVRQALAIQSARTIAAKKGNDAIAALRKEIAAGVSESFNTQLVFSELIKRDDSKIQQQIVQKVFKMAKPVDQIPSVSGVQLPNGDYAVVMLEDVKEDSEPVSDEVGKTAATPQTTQHAISYGEEELEAAFEMMESQATVTIFRDNL